MNWLRKMFARETHTELAIDIYERQEALKQKQQLARDALGTKYACHESRALPRKGSAQAERVISETFGPPPKLNVIVNRNWFKGAVARYSKDHDTTAYHLGRLEDHLKQLESLKW